MKQVMDKTMSGHTLVVFPPSVVLIMALVRQDLPVVKDRLTGGDAGEETQRLQKLIEQRLEGMLRALSGGDSRPTPPPNWGDHFMDTVGSDVDRTADVKMIIMLQTQINQRTAELEALRAAGKMDGAKIAAECKDLAALQGKIQQMIQRQLEIIARKGGP